MNESPLPQQQEWIIVGKPRRKKIKKQQKNQGKEKNGKVIWAVGKPLYQSQNQKADLQSFENSSSFIQNKQIIRQKIEQRQKKQKISNIHIQCLGLGDFLKYKKPKYQYFFLKSLLIPLSSSVCPSVSINCYDPIFPQACLQKLYQFSTCLADNVPSLSPQTLIILYMPHCQRFLHEKYCSVYANNDVIVIGNSIRDYVDRCNLLGQQVPLCFKSREKLSETRIRDFRESFNDTYCYFI